MERFDLYTSIHKGIRRVLFETARTVSATDFGDARESAEAAAAVERSLRFLDEHAAHEDGVILPELAVLAPELFIDLRDEHARLDGLQREIEGVLARLGGANECERLSLGRRLEDRMGKLVAAHLMHLAHEESDANRVLWAHKGDPALVELQARILAGIEPERLGEWYALALPAMNARERRALLGELHAGVPAGAFERITAAARAELGEVRWSEAVTTVVG